MTFPVCDIFEPTVYEGRLCYQVDVKKHSGQTAFEGKESGLMLLIDVNSEKSIDITDHGNKRRNESTDNVYLGPVRMMNKNMAAIHVGTLARYTGYGPGEEQAP